MDDPRDPQVSDVTPSAQNQLVPTPQSGGGQLAEQRKEIVVGLLGEMNLLQLDNFPPDPVERWRMMAIAENGSKPGNELGANEVFTIHYFYAHKVRIVDPRDGEVIEPTRVVFMDDKENCIHFTSDGIVKSLARILQTHGFGPWPAGIPVTVKKIQTRNKFNTFTLLPAKAAV